jgi:hypothetical protein
VPSFSVTNRRRHVPAQDCPMSQPRLNFTGMRRLQRMLPHSSPRLEPLIRPAATTCVNF